MLQYNYPELFGGGVYSSGGNAAGVKVAGTDQTLIVIDGEVIDYRDLELGRQYTLSVSEIIGVEVIKEAKNFALAHLEAYQTFPDFSVMSGSILAIYT